MSYRGFVRKDCPFRYKEISEKTAHCNIDDSSICTLSYRGFDREEDTFSYRGLVTEHGTLSNNGLTERMAHCHIENL